MELTANALFNSRVLNTGQVCNAAERATRLMAEAKYGNPLTDSGLQMGPLMKTRSCLSSMRQCWP